MVGGAMVTQNMIALGAVWSFTQYSNRFSQPITQSAYIAIVIQSGIASAERMFELLDEPEQVPEAAAPAKIDSPRGYVAFQQVRSGYSAEKILMQKMNIEARPD